MRKTHIGVIVATLTFVCLLAAVAPKNYSKTWGTSVLTTIADLSDRIKVLEKVQPPPPPPPPAPIPPLPSKLYVVPDLPPGAALPPNSEQCIFVYESSLDNDHDGVLNVDDLLNDLNWYIPDKNYAGMIVIDWEGRLESNWYYGDTASVEQYRRTASIIRNQRPRALIGIYSPLFGAVEFERLVDAVDVLTIHIYPNSDHPDEVAVAASRVAIARTHAKGKPVLAVVNHLFSEYTGSYAGKPVAEIQMYETSKAAMNAKADGLMWWSASDVSPQEMRALAIFHAAATKQPAPAAPPTSQPVR